jgi:methyltransferase (TIGR00027 family)
MSVATSAGELLASTARWTAAVRAQESERPDRLLDDPWAAELAGTEGFAWLEKRTPEAVLPMVLRTRYFDDFLAQGAIPDGIRQVVVMAAGLDTRAFRLEVPAATRWFELDQPEILAHKERVLGAAGARPKCARHALGVDLTGPWADALMGAGFAPLEPAAWLLEGFLFYLSFQDLTTLLDQVLRMAPTGSRIGFDIINSATLTSPFTRSWVDMQAASGAPWIGALDDPVGFLAERGWTAAAVPLGAEEASYSRWPYPPVPAALPGVPYLWFVTGQKGK